MPRWALILAAFFLFFTMAIPTFLSLYGYGVIINSLYFFVFLIFTVGCVKKVRWFSFLMLGFISVLSAFPLYPNFIYFSEPRGVYITVSAFVGELVNDLWGSIIYLSVFFIFAFIYRVIILAVAPSARPAGE